jgi:hypothetical protein
MAEKHLIEAITKKYQKMSRNQRIKTIRSLSEDGVKFVRHFCPQFYAEAFPETSRAAVASSEPRSRSALSAKTR